MNSYQFFMHDFDLWTFLKSVTKIPRYLIYKYLFRINYSRTSCAVVLIYCKLIYVWHLSSIYAFIRGRASYRNGLMKLGGRGSFATFLNFRVEAAKQAEARCIYVETYVWTLNRSAYLRERYTPKRRLLVRGVARCGSSDRSISSTGTSFAPCWQVSGMAWKWLTNTAGGEMLKYNLRLRSPISYSNLSR